MKLEKKDYKYPILIFEQKIDGEDAMNLLDIFRDWVEKEDNDDKKDGELFNFYAANEDDNYSLRFGNDFNTVDVCNGLMPFMEGNDLSNRAYKYLLNEAIGFIEEYAKIKNLKLNITPTNGISKQYVVSR
jgi:hypothetical protein